MFIAKIKENLSTEEAQAALPEGRSQSVELYGRRWLFSPDPLEAYPVVEPATVKSLDQDFKLSSRKFKSEDTYFELSSQLALSPDKTLMVAGPCAVESYDQIMRSAEFLAGLGIKAFRAGAFKPRTTPWKFQGLGEEGLRLLDEVRRQFGFTIFTEVRSGGHVAAVAEVADVIQVGAKAMYDHDILRSCGDLRKPILLKRGFGSTLKELLLAADFILQGGNERVALCFRGTRDFESETRFSMDIGGAVRCREMSHLPIVIDPSHAVGIASLVPQLALAGAAIGPAALLVEVHPNPAEAKSDAAQALSHQVFEKLYRQCQAVAQAVGKELY